MTLGNAAAARVRLIVWCKACGHRAEPDAAEIAQRYGGETTVPEWRARLVCSHCGSRDCRYGGDRDRARRDRPLRGATSPLPSVFGSCLRTATMGGKQREINARYRRGVAGRGIICPPPGDPETGAELQYLERAVARN
jgi:hypothetical protein